MSAQSAIASVARIANELYNEGNLAVLDEVFTPGYVEHWPYPAGFPAGIEGVRLYVTLIRTAFPDFRYTLEGAVAEGDNLVARVTASGTHQGDFMGLPATGRAVSWQEAHFCRVEGDKLAEHWVIGDPLGMLQQLGVLTKEAVAV